MFKEPMRPFVRIADMSDLKRFAVDANKRYEECSKVMTTNNGLLAYANEYGQVMVTPFVREAKTVLYNEGYCNGSIWVPYSNGKTFGEVIPERMVWLRKLHSENVWAETYAKAVETARTKGIDDSAVKYNTAELKICEIEPHYGGYIFQPGCEDVKALVIRGMTSQYLLNDSAHNIGTFTRLDRKNLVLCEEYGRTFVVTAKGTINEFVNSLLEAGYQVNTYPESFITTYDEEVPDYVANRYYFLY